MNRSFSRVQNRPVSGGRSAAGRRYLAALATLALAPWSYAANASWNVDADGNWSDGANWSTAAAPGATSGTSSADIATFNKVLTAVRTVTVDANRVIGGITFAQTSNFGYTLAGGPLLLASGGTIQFSNSSPTVTPSQTNSITAPLVIQGDGSFASLWGNGTSGFTFLSIGDISGVSTAGNTTTVRLVGFSATSNRVTGVISDGTAGGKVAVAKTGSGLWQLNSGLSTYSGGTSVGAGQLSVGASSTPTSGTVTSGPLGTGTITFGSGGFLQAGAANVTLANAISIPFGANTNVRGTGSGNIILTGPVTGVGTFTNNHTTSASAIVQGDISGFTGTFAHNTVATGNNFTFSGTTPESQNGSNARFILSGATTGRALNIGSTEAPTFQMGELTGAGGRIAPNITTGTTLKIGALNTSPVTPFSGVITGTALALEKVGTGTLVLAGANSHTGATTVSAGTLRVTGTGSITASPVTVASGATFGGEGTLSQPLTLSAGSTLALDASTAGALQVNNDLSVSGPVFIDLEAASATPSVGQTARVVNYTGALSGTPSFDVSRLRNATVSTATPNQINVTFDTKSLVWSGQSAVWAVGGSTNWNGGADSFYQGDVVSFDDTGANKNITLSGNLTPASVTFNNSAGNDYALSGSGRLVGGTTVTKSGGGVVTLSGTQAYTGLTTVNGGTLKVAGLGIGAGFAVSNGGTLEVTGANGLTGSGAVTVGQGGTVVLASSNNLTGAVTIDGTLQLRDSASIATSTALNLNNGGTLQLRSDADATFTVPTVALASGGNATIDVAPSTTVGNHTLTIGAISFTGASTSSALNVTGTDGQGLTVNGLTITNNNTVSTSVTRTRLTLRANTAPLTVTGTITATSAASRDVGIILDGTNTGSRFLSRITNAGGGWTFLDKQGSGTWTLSGTACNYAGATTIASGGGILRVDNPSAISTSSAVQFSKGGTATGTLQLDAPGAATFTQAMNSSSSSTFGAGGTANVQNLQGDTTLSGNLTITGTGGSGMNIQSDVGGSLKLTGTLKNNVASSNRLFDLGGAGNGEVSGVISDGTATAAVTSLMKEGSGTWTITGATNTYTGSTTVNGGTLAVTGTGTLGTGAFILGNGATLNVSGLTAGSFNVPAGLSGSGLLNAAGKSVQISGAFAPLAVAITGNVTLAAGSTSAFAADTSVAARSATIVTGSLQNGGALTITPATGFSFAGGQNFDFVDATGGITAGYTSVTVGTIALTQSPAGVWTGTDGTLNYTYTEASGVLGVTSNVVADTTPPVITLTGSSSVTVNWGSPYTDAGATATDNVDPSVTVSASGTVNTAKPGVYTITYNATDVAGNPATPVTRTVTVSIANATTPGADGYSPLLRYALGANSPTDTVQAPVLSSTSTTLSLTAAVRTDDPNLTVGAEAVNDLTGTWGTGGTITVVNAADQTGVPAGATRKVFSVDRTGATKKFLRLKATLAP